MTLFHLSDFRTPRPHGTGRVVQSYGLGTDSTAILLRWLTDPTRRDFDLSDLTVVTAMTGDEWEQTRRDVEAHVLPRLREHGVRFIQVARARRHVTAAGDGIVRHVMGFETGEARRADKDWGYNTDLRTGEYPLIEWGWNRGTCEVFLERITGTRWQKSACSYCPFALHNTTSRAAAFDRYRTEPDRARHALRLEHVALALNPAQGLIGRSRLIDDLTRAGYRDVVDDFLLHVLAEQHALYEVRRVLRPRKNDPTKLANVSRSVRTLDTGDRDSLLADLAGLGRVEVDGPHHRVWLRDRGQHLPSTEHLLTVAPVGVADKQPPNFDRWWQAALDTAA